MPPHAAMQQAAQWYARLRSSDASAQDRRDWQAWLEQRREHRDAWAYAESIARRFDPLRAPDARHPAVATLQGARALSRTRRRVLGGLGGLGLMTGGALLGWGAWPGQSSGFQTLLAQQRTGTGEVRAITLADGTQVWLNTASALDAEMQPQLRRVQLRAGEILVQTAHDASRPFVVDTSHGRLRALGTRFTVRLDGERTFIAVYQGAVEVRTGGGVRHVIEAGSQTSFNYDTIAFPQAADAAREAWSRGVLLAENITLQEVVAELNRYHRGHIGVAPAVANLRVLGGYPLHDADQTLNMLAQVLPLRIHRTLPWWTTVSKS